MVPRSNACIQGLAHLIQYQNNETVFRILALIFHCNENREQPTYLYKTYNSYYRPPKKLQEGSVFRCVWYAHYPESIRPHSTGSQSFCTGPWPWSSSVQAHPCTGPASLDSDI